MPAIGPAIKGCQLAGMTLSDAEEHPEGLQSQQAADDADERRDHASGGTILLCQSILAVEALITRTIWNLWVNG